MKREREWEIREGLGAPCIELVGLSVEKFFSKAAALLNFLNKNRNGGMSKETLKRASDYVLKLSRVPDTVPADGNVSFESIKEQIEAKTN